MCDEMLATATLVQIKRNNNSDKSEPGKVEKVDKIDKNTIISIHYKDEIVKINASQFNKLLIREVLKVIFKNQSDSVTRHLNRLMVVNSRSIIDDVMTHIRNNIPVPNRYTVDLGTLFDPQMTSKIISIHTAMKNNVPMPTEEKKSENSMSIANPMKSALRNIIIKNKNKCLPRLPAVPPYNNLSTWKSVPSAPMLNIEQKNNKLLLSWNMESRNEVAKIQFYELYYCQEAENSNWKKFPDIDAKQLPMSMEIDTPSNNGKVYCYILRAVDVHERRAPFTFRKLSL